MLNTYQRWYEEDDNVTPPPYLQVAKEVDLIDFGGEGDDNYGSDGGHGGGHGGGRTGPFLYRSLPRTFDEYGVLPCTASTGGPTGLPYLYCDGSSICPL